MALPKFNVTPQYTMVIPSTGQEVLFRPYLVKEEKILLMAFESKETKAILRAMLNVIESCIEGDIDTAELATFDVEYMFLKIRAKSVGESSNINIKCSDCGTPNEYSVNLDDLEVEVPQRDNVIKLTNEISIEMKYPTYNDMVKSDLLSEGHKATADDLFGMVARGISAVLTDEERYDLRDSTKEEVQEFIESLTSNQFAQLNEYFEGMPTLKHEASFACSSCGHENKMMLQGMADFF